MTMSIDKNMMFLILLIGRNKYVCGIGFYAALPPQVHVWGIRAQRVNTDQHMQMPKQNAR